MRHLDLEATTATATLRVGDGSARQREVAAIGGLVAALVLVVSLRAGELQAHDRTLVDPVWLRTAAVAVALGFCAYALDQEHRFHLRGWATRRPADLVRGCDGHDRNDRRPDRAHRDGRDTDHDTGDDTIDVRVDAVVESVHAPLLVGDVVAALLDAVVEITRATGAVVHLVGADGVARPAGRRGADLGSARHRESIAVEHAGRHLGDVTIAGVARDADRVALEVVVRHAGAALVNARRYEHALLLLDVVRAARVGGAEARIAR